MSILENSHLHKLSYEEIFSNRPTLRELKKMKRLPIYALVENIRSMHNVGSIFRSSDGARIQELILSGFTPSPPRREIDKTALGATDSVPWIYIKDPLVKVKELKKRGIRIIAVEHTRESRLYTNVTYQFPLCVIVGNEVEGISEALLSAADEAIELPMLGLKQSLNVSVAFGIIVYHLMQQYLARHDVNP